MNQAISKLFTPSMGGWLNFGMNIWSAGESRAAQATAAWQKWEADSARALRQAVHTNKQNYRAHQVDMTNWLARSKHVSELRQYENQLAVDRADLKTETSINATEALGRKYADLNARFYEEEASETIQLENLRNKVDSKKFLYFNDDLPENINYCRIEPFSVNEIAHQRYSTNFILQT